MRFGSFALLAISLAATPALSENVANPLAPLNDAIVVMGRRIVPDNPDVLGTAAIDAGVTIYDVRFRRVSADRDDARLRIIADALRGLSPPEQLAKVKLLVGRLVRIAPDLETMRVHDYWSNASDTLNRGAGDDEDIAIVQMQALKAAGFATRDLYISVGRHRSRGLHTVLIARTPQGFFMLDSAEPRVIAASGSASASFTPIMTIGAGRSWLHGYRTRRTASNTLASR